MMKYAPIAAIFFPALATAFLTPVPAKQQGKGEAEGTRKRGKPLTRRMMGGLNVARDVYITLDVSCACW